MNKLLVIKADGKAMLALELDPANIHCLKQNKPILLDLGKMFPQGRLPQHLEILISYTETPAASAAQAESIADVLADERQATRPHCPECRSTVETVGVLRNQTPLALTFCPACGCLLGLVATELTRGMIKNSPMNGSERTQ